MSNVLFNTFAMRQIDLPNRIVIAPMCQYSAEDGNLTDWHLMHLGSLSHSGAGLLIVESTAVSAEGRITPSCAGLWNDANEASFERVLTAIRRYSAMPIGIQLSHAGRKASCAAPWEGGQQLSSENGGWATVGPSSIPFLKRDTPPDELDGAGLEQVRQAFIQAARRADRLEFDLIELHAAHGYLLHQFLSPLSNQRTDKYGGNLENRMRFPLEVFEATRNAWPAHKPLGVRVSATDWVENGWDCDQTVVFSRKLKEVGCDYVHVSSGGLIPLLQMHSKPGFQVPFARRVKTEAGIATIAVGLITEAHQAEAIISERSADLVALARGILYDPRWPWHAAVELGAQVRVPKQYWRSPPIRVKDVLLLE